MVSLHFYFLSNKHLLPSMAPQATAQQAFMIQTSWFFIRPNMTYDSLLINVFPSPAKVELPEPGWRQRGREGFPGANPGSWAQQGGASHRQQADSPDGDATGGPAGWKGGDSIRTPSLTYW